MRRNNANRQLSATPDWPQRQMKTHVRNAYTNPLSYLPFRMDTADSCLPHPQQTVLFGTEHHFRAGCRRTVDADRCVQKRWPMVDDDILCTHKNFHYVTGGGGRFCFRFWFRKFVVIEFGWFTGWWLAVRCANACSWLYDVVEDGHRKQTAAYLQHIWWWRCAVVSSETGQSHTVG